MALSWVGLDGWTWATCMNCEQPIKTAVPGSWTHENYDYECSIRTPHAYPAKDTERGSRMICPYGDPTCPCPDGLLCHYEGPDPMTPPAPEDRHA